MSRSKTKYTDCTRLSIIFLFIFIFATVLHQCSSESGVFEFSDKEITALEKFRALVQDVLYADYLSMDAYLIRWIRDQDFDLEAANEKLRKCIEWRKRTGIDTIFQDPMLQELNKTYPVLRSGIAKNGSPVITTSYGMWKVRRLILNGMGAAVNRHMQSALELGQVRVTELQKEGRNVTQMIFLSDLTGFSLKEHACLACKLLYGLPVYINIALAFENYFPGLVQVTIAINGAKIFENVMALLPPNVRRIIKVYGFNRNEWQEAIFNLISPDQLTTQFGGSRSKDS